MKNETLTLKDGGTKRLGNQPAEVRPAKKQRVQANSLGVEDGEVITVTRSDGTTYSANMSSQVFDVFSAALEGGSIAVGSTPAPSLRDRAQALAIRANGENP